MPLLPYVRRELFLQAIKNRDASALPDPNNREELFLKAIAEDVALIPSGVSVVLPAAVSEMLANLPEAHTHTELFYKDIIDAILIATTVTDTTPFISRETAGGLPVSGTANLKKKLGNTVGVNQQLREFSSSYWDTEANVTVTFTDGVATFSTTAAGYGIKTKGTFTTIPNRTYFVMADVKADSSAELTFLVGGTSGVSASKNVGTSYTRVEMIVATGANSVGQFYIYPKNAADVGKTYNVKNAVCIDLTLWFGSTDRIPSDLLSHPENWGRYYAGSLAYNAGTLESADGAELNSIGRQMWDEETKRFSLSGNGLLGSKNPIRIDPNITCYVYCPTSSYNVATNGVFVQYYDADMNIVSEFSREFSTTVTAPAGAIYMDFGFFEYYYGESYKGDITISRYYPGESGYDQYYPYSVLAEVDTGSEVLRSAGAVADEKTPDGTITRKVIDIDLSTLNYNGANANGRTYSYGLTGIQTPSAGNVVPNVRSAKYIALTEAGWYAADTPGITITGNGYGSDGQIGMVDPALANMNSDQIKAALSGVHVYAELATPATEQGTAFDPEYVVENGGTETWTNLKGIPQGHETDYMEYTT